MAEVYQKGDSLSVSAAAKPADATGKTVTLTVQTYAVPRAQWFEGDPAFTTVPQTVAPSAGNPGTYVVDHVYPNEGAFKITVTNANGLREYIKFQTPHAIKAFDPDAYRLTEAERKQAERDKARHLQGVTDELP